MSSSQDRSEKPSKSGPRFGKDQTQEEFDLEFYGQVLQRSGDNPDVMRRQAELFSRRGDYSEALRLDEKLVERFPEDQVARYNLACSLALNGHVRRAISTLAKAIEIGYADFAHIETDSDLDILRDEPSFTELLRRHGIGDF